VNEYLTYVHNYMTTKEGIPRPRRGFYPSEASCVVTNSLGQEEIVGRCLREVYWKWHGEPETNTVSAQTERKFLLGKYVEIAEIDVMKRAGIFVDNNVKWVSKYLGMSGEVDAVVRLPNLGIVGIELKSVWGYNGVKGVITSSRNVQFFPKLSHLMQVMSYAYHFTYESSYKMPIFKIVYIARGSTETGEHTIRVNENGQPLVNGELYHKITIGGMKERIDLFMEYVENQELPPRDFDYKYSRDKVALMADNKLLNKTDTAVFERGKTPTIADFQCRYCNYLNKCQEVGGCLRYENSISLEG
jgi:hypothetical protein